mmetsp:Transcript_6020/g.7670  ORF Transcript_6020/g.7670 Transcript_6020/m.7670 type:complete len:93 (+) Transcript_6020:1459-1737(+)
MGVGVDVDEKCFVKCDWIMDIAASLPDDDGPPTRKIDVQLNDIFFSSFYYFFWFKLLLFLEVSIYNYRMLLFLQSHNSQLTRYRFKRSKKGK